MLSAILFPSPSAARPAAVDAAQLRERIETTVGSLPWAPAGGYRLSGRLILKATGEEIPYQAIYLRTPKGWAAEFIQADSTHNLRCGSIPRPWASSPEITSDIRPEQLPFCAQYDFPSLYSELLRILAEAKRDPQFRLESDGYEIVVRGTLRNRLIATFLLQNADCYPRKVSFTGPGEMPPAWLIPALEAGSRAALLPLPAGKSDRFEIWFSQPSDMGGFRIPTRADYVAQAGLAATFLLDSAAPAGERDSVSVRPPDLPWLGKVAFRPGRELHRPSLYLRPDEFASFRARLRGLPWSSWSRTNRIAAVGGLVALQLDRYVPSFSSPLGLALLLAVVMLGFVVILRRRSRIYGRRVSFKWTLAAVALWLAILLSGIAKIQLQNAATRGLVALHAATRYVVTGNPLHAATVKTLLLTIPEPDTPATLDARADACRAYALAYDLISSTLPRAVQARIERRLFDYAVPLYGALQGWRAGTSAGSRFAAGLGMAGLAIGCEEYVAAGREAMERLLTHQLSGGIHREGPGPGAAAFDSAAGFFHALNRLGRADYYRRDEFLDYVRATLQITSPSGTLPLFEGTSFDHSAHAAPFLLKTASHLAGELGSRCVAANDAYWRSGCYNSRGFHRLLARLVQPARCFLANPYTIFEYETALPAVELPAISSVLADGQYAVLRAGRGKESVYLALNARRSLLTDPARDTLGFDLYAYNGLALHGPGVPGQGHKDYPLAGRTSSANCVTFDEADQTGTASAGAVCALLNQPLFDHVRLLADRSYDQGQVQRDVVMIRPERDHAAYFLLIDEIHSIGPNVKVQWRLHGRGDLKIGLNGLSRWKSAAFEPPAWRSTDLFLTVFPISVPGRLRQLPGVLYYQDSARNQNAPALFMEWTGSSRFGAILVPRTTQMPEPAFNPIPGQESCRIGAADWISLGTPGTRVNTASFRHVSEFVVVRERGRSFPALLMIGGTEFLMGAHSVVSDKPIFLSIDGLQGSLLNFRPDTRVELRSPDIAPGRRFRLDGTELEARESGMLNLVLTQPGEHHLLRAP